jgi:hypothetical protein
MFGCKFFGSVFLVILSTQLAGAQVITDSANLGLVFSPSQSIGAGGDIRIANLVADPSVVDQIEMVDYQRAEIRKLILELGTVNNVASKKYVDTLKNAKSVAEREKALQVYESACRVSRIVGEAKIKEKLLPHQILAIGNIAFQKQIQTVGIRGLFSSPVARALGLSDQEKAALAKKAKKINEQLNKDIKKLKEKAVEDLVSELPVDKQKLLKQNFGVSISK